MTCVNEEMLDFYLCIYSLSYFFYKLEYSMTVTWEGVSKNWSLPELAKDTEVDCLQNELALYNAFMLMWFTS